MEGTPKFVNPEGRSHTIEGGTNRARLQLSASSDSLASTGTDVVLSDGSSEIPEHLELLAWFKLVEDGVVSITDSSSEDAEIPCPVSGVLGASGVCHYRAVCFVCRISPTMSETTSYFNASGWITKGVDSLASFDPPMLR